MSSSLFYTLLFGLIAAGANMIGGYWISYQKNLDRALLKGLVALGAGFLMAATFLVIIPKSLPRQSYAGLLILAGYLFVQFAEHTVAPHFHFGEETHSKSMVRSRVAYAALFGLALHTFFDGALIAAGFVISHRVGVLLFVAILLHKIPEGVTAASIMRASGKSRRITRLSAEIIAISTFAGILLVALARDLVEYVLPFSAGVTLYVAASDLIPEVNREEGKWVSVFVFVGALLYFVTERLLDVFVK